MVDTTLLHLCDALYVHCATWRSVPCDAILRCICAMHFMFIVPMEQISFALIATVASVRCTLCSLCLSTFRIHLWSKLVASVRCTLCSLCQRLNRHKLPVGGVASVRCTLCSLCHGNALYWWNGRAMLHLCDALYVHCAWRSPLQWTKP